MTVGFLNWVTLQAWGRRVYRDHYESDAKLRAAANASRPCSEESCMTVRGTPAPTLYLPGDVLGEPRPAVRRRRVPGSPPVCSYGMPEFYNRVIDCCQWLRVTTLARMCRRVRAFSMSGCGVGRWSRRLARRGATVTGIDLSPTMIAQARERARAGGRSASAVASKLRTSARWSAGRQVRSFAGCDRASAHPRSAGPA